MLDLRKYEALDREMRSLGGLRSRALTRGDLDAAAEYADRLSACRIILAAYKVLAERETPLPLEHLTSVLDAITDAAENDALAAAAS